MESIASHISNDEPREDFAEPDNESADKDVDGMDGDELRIQELSEKPAQKPSNSKKAKKLQADNKTARKHPKLSIEEEKQLQLMDEMENDIVEERKQKREKSEDAEDAFCASLASGLRQFSQKERYLIKHEIDILLSNIKWQNFTPKAIHTFWVMENSFAAISARALFIKWQAISSTESLMLLSSMRAAPVVQMT